ncbi:MAG: hypothetical protein RBR24_00095 [Candidatus Carbobacillus sp.]|nr:hypothetical protein [Candidatus Carbobacillus sp.]
MSDYGSWRKWTEEAIRAAQQRDIERLEAALEKRAQWITDVHRSASGQQPNAPRLQWPAGIREEAVRLEETLKTVLREMERAFTHDFLQARRMQVMEKAYYGSDIEWTGGFFDVKR